MAYTKQTWQTGDTVTSTKLNHMEDGIEAASVNELPAVTTTNNGNVLTVVSGAWAAAQSQVPTITPSDDIHKVLVVSTNNTWVKGFFEIDKLGYLTYPTYWSLNKTYKDIENRLKWGSRIFLDFLDGTTHYYYPLIGLSEGAKYAVYFFDWQNNQTIMFQGNEKTSTLIHSLTT